MRRTKNKSAFTLIELLVVIAIIALLVSILLPSLQKAKELAQISVCLTNLRGIGSAMFTYAGEYDGYPPEAWDGNVTWSRKMLNRGYASNFRCPAHMPLNPVASEADLRSYTLNGWTTVDPSYASHSWARYLPVEAVTEPSISSLSAEEWRGAYWDSGVLQQENTIDFSKENINFLLWFNNIYNCVNGMELHGEDLNQSILFYDGHTESYPFESFDGTRTPENMYGWKWYLYVDNI